MQLEGHVKSRTELPWNLASRLLNNQKKAAYIKEEGRKIKHTGESGHSRGEGGKVKRKYVRETQTSLVPDAIHFQVHAW